MKEPAYGHPYFETLGHAPGLNRIKHNTLRVLDFSLLVLGPGEEFRLETGAREYGFCLLRGTADIAIGEKTFPALGGRESIFTTLPSGAYAGCGQTALIRALDACEIGIGSAPSATPIEAYAFTPESLVTGHWGNDRTLRHYRHMINGDRPSERLWFTEVVVRDGRWATYPPHKHEDIPGDIFQEEVYYYRVEPAHGFGFCGLFEGQVEDDYAFVIRDRTIHKMPFGNHTVVSAPGYQIYYLAAYAGHTKYHKPTPHPDHVGFADNPMPDPMM